MGMVTAEPNQAFFDEAELCERGDAVVEPDFLNDLT